MPESFTVLCVVEDGAKLEHVEKALQGAGVTDTRVLSAVRQVHGTYNGDVAALTKIAGVKFAEKDQKVYALDDDNE